MAHRTSKNNVLAGLLFLGSLALGVGVIIGLSDLGDRLTRMDMYKVRFSLTDGAEGLKSGSLVKVGGQPVGRVTAWEFDRSPVDAEGAKAGVAGAKPGAGGPAAESGNERAPTGVLVSIKVRADLRLYEDAVVLLNLALLGSNSYINIPELGNGDKIAQGKQQGTSALLEPGETLRGRLAPPSFLAQAGYGEEQANQLQAVLARADSITASVNDQWDPRVRGILDDIRSVTADVREKWPTWAQRVADTLENVKASSDKFGSITDTVKAGVDEARAIIADNRPRIDSTLKEVEELAHKANTEGWEMVKGVLERGKQGIDDFADIAARADRFAVEELPQLKETIANARLASDQLKLTLEEVRANPWKLLSKPTGRKELENEALYDSARIYSESVSDLKATARALESVTAASAAAGAATAEDRAQVAMLAADLDKAFAKYRDAEKRFLEKLAR